MHDIVILGAGGGAKSVLWLLETINDSHRDWNILGFIDDDPVRHGTRTCELPVLGGFEWLNGRAPLVVHGVGSPVIRRRFAARVLDRGLEFARTISPDARHSRFVSFGVGTLVCSGVVLTSHIQVGNHCMINLGCTIGHDTVIEDYCTLAPGVHLSGNSRLEEGVDVGAGAVVIPGKRIGKNSVIGAGAVVTTDIPPASVAVGVPARVIKAVAAA